MLSELKKTGGEGAIRTPDTALDRITVSQTRILECFLTREQLAAELGKSLRTIDRWEVRRIGPPRVIVGRTIWCRAESVRSWLRVANGTRGAAVAKTQRAPAAQESAMIGGTTTERNFLNRMLLSPPFVGKSGDCARRRSLSM